MHRLFLSTYLHVVSCRQGEEKRTEKNRAEESRGEQSRTEQRRRQQIREDGRAEHNRKDHWRAEQRGKEKTADQRRGESREKRRGLFAKRFDQFIASKTIPNLSSDSPSVAHGPRIISLPHR